MRGLYRTSPILLGPLLLAAAAALLAASRLGQTPRESPEASLDDWELAEMIAYLERSGVEGNVISSRRDGLLNNGAFLTTTTKDWAELNRLLKVREYIEGWRGTVYVERGRVGTDWSARAGIWGDCCLVAGPFIFFGDRDLLARVRAALDGRTPGSPI